MKVFINGKVYVQNKDLAYFTRGVGGMDFPTTIFSRMHEEGLFQPFINDPSIRYKFVEFSSSKEIDFFRNCDWIIDYHDFDDMSDEEIAEYSGRIDRERLDLMNSYAGLSPAERMREQSSFSRRLDRLEYKRISVEELLLFRHGEINFDMPEEQKKKEDKQKKKGSFIDRLLRNINK